MLHKVFEACKLSGVSVRGGQFDVEQWPCTEAIPILLETSDTVPTVVIPWIRRDSRALNTAGESPPAVVKLRH